MNPIQQAIARASIIVMGLFAYLILSIVFYQKAMADPLEVKDEYGSNQLGWLYEMYTSGDTHGQDVSGMVVVNGIVGAAAGRAAEECRSTTDGDIDASCTIERYNSLLEYLSITTRTMEGDTTNEDLTSLFWKWVLWEQIDGSVRAAIVYSTFVNAIVLDYEKRS